MKMTGHQDKLLKIILLKSFSKLNQTDAVNGHIFTVNRCGHQANPFCRVFERVLGVAPISRHVRLTQPLGCVVGGKNEAKEMLPR